MKIAFVLPGGGRSGGVRCTVIAANELLSRGHKVRLLFKRGGVRGRSMSYLRGVFFGGAKDWLDDFNGPIAPFGEITKIKFHEDEIIVGVGMWSSAQLDKVSALSNHKVQYLHGLTPWDPELQKLALNLPYPKIAVASYIKEILPIYGNSGECTIVPNGIDGTDYYPSLDELERDGIGTIYAPGWAKDPGTIIDVLARLRNELPAVPQYVFGTAGCPTAIPARDYKQYPSVQDARRLYSRSRVWIMASRAEGFSLPVLEAMACGCAVVTTDCGGPKDIVRNGENGFLVEVGGVDQIVQKVKTLIEDDLLRLRMSERAKETAKDFSWAKSVDGLEAVFRKIL